MNKLLSIITLGILVALSGCANMADSMNKMAGVGVLSEEQSTFDSAKIIKVSPNWLYESQKSWTANSIKLGARWNSAAPDLVVLDLSYDSSTSGGATYVSLQGMDLNIDGEKSSYKTEGSTLLNSSNYNTVTKTIYTNSKNSIIIPLSTLKSMVNAKDCRIRIHTSKGYEDSIFSIERSDSGQGTALLSIKQFIEKVSTVK